MLPALSVVNATNERLADAVFGCQKLADPAGLRSRELSNPKHLFVRQLGLLNIGSPSSGFWRPKFAVATLCHLVRNVIGVGSKKEMSRPDTRGTVAMVKNLEPLRNRAIHKLPLNAVSQTMDPPPLRPHAQASVAIAVSMTSPCPALRSRVGVLGHTFDGGCSRFTHCIATIAQLGVDFKPSGGQ